MHIRLAPERRRELVEVLLRFWREEFDEELSDFRAERVVELLAARLGPAVYNQAVQDTRGYVLEKLEDVAGELYEPEPEPDGERGSS